MAVETLLLEEAIFSGLKITGDAWYSLVDGYRRMDKLNKARMNDPSELIARVMELRAKLLIAPGDTEFERVIQDLMGYLPLRKHHFIRVDVRPTSNAHCNVKITLDYEHGRRILEDSYQIATEVKNALYPAKDFLRSMGFSIGIM